jgi:glycosyltransferase involved in cell wall biosynthesis
MIMGAFPIQSDTVSTGEWIDNGRNGLLVPPEDPAEVADALRKAVSDDLLVNQAADFNNSITRARVDMEVVRPQVINAYQQVAGCRPFNGCFERSAGHSTTKMRVGDFDQ